MFQRRFLTYTLAFTVSLSALPLQAEEELYTPGTTDEVYKQVTDWVTAQKPSEEVKKQVDDLWKERADLQTRDLLDRTIETFALVDKTTGDFIKLCKFRDAPLKAPEEEFEDLDLSNEFYASHMQLFFARYLTQRKMYDEALWVMEELEPKRVLDPATYFFHRSVCEQQLFLRKEGLKTVGTLLKNTENVPSSYSTVATLMQYQLEQMKEKSLGHVAVKMNDSGRRLELARSGHRTQKVQGEIITLLDEIIEKMEQQMGGGGGGGGGSAENNSNESSSPADESRVKGATAPGDVEKKSFKDRSVWGDLPKKEETRANNIINRNFPSHYRKQIEEYSKRLTKHRAPK